MLRLSRALLPQRFAPVGNGRFLKSPRFTRAFFYAGRRDTVFRQRLSRAY